MVTVVQQSITQIIVFFTPNLFQHEIQNNTQQPSPLLGLNQQTSSLIPQPINSQAVNDQDKPVMHLIAPTADAFPATSCKSVKYVVPATVLCSAPTRTVLLIKPKTLDPVLTVYPQAQVK